MKKVIDFLERYVQWLALGLGLVWILWVGYAYWASKPVAITINNQIYGPGEIDDYVNRPGGAIETLIKAHKNETKTPVELTRRFGSTPPQYAEAFRQTMALNDYVAPKLSPMFAYDTKGVERIKEGPSEQMVPAVLPVLPPGTLAKVETTAGLSVATKPDPTVAINPADTTQKVILPDPANPTAKPIALVPAEVSWVTVLCKLDMQKVATAFKEANISEQAAFTQFLRVRLVREEMLPDGKWGNQVEVPDLVNQHKLPYPPEAGSPQEGLYLDWSSKNVADIIQPAFYEWLRGDAWRTASMQQLATAAVAPVEFDPATVKPGEVGTLTPEHLKLYQAWKAQKDKEELERRKSEKPARPRTTPGRGTPSSSPEMPIADRIGTPSEGGRAPEHGRRGGPSGLYPRNQDRRLNQPSIPGYPNPANPTDLPQGMFVPATSKDLEIWAHDETTKPGHTYHYKLFVHLKNPIFGTQGMTKEPANEKKIDIATSSDWSAPVVSPRKNYFFAYNSGDSLQANNPKMKFEYFWWEDGDWKTKVIELHPGDSVGGTAWTVVDFRANGAGTENHALVINDNGEIESHYYKTDQANPEYKRLKALIKPATASNTTGG